MKYIFDLLEADNACYIWLRNIIDFLLVVIEQTIPLFRQEAKEDRTRQIVLCHGREKIRERNLYVDSTWRGLQNIKKQTKHMSFGSVGGESHGGRLYSRQTHTGEIVNSQGSFPYD